MFGYEQHRRVNYQLQTLSSSSNPWLRKVSNFAAGDKWLRAVSLAINHPRARQVFPAAMG